LKKRLPPTEMLRELHYVDDPAIKVIDAYRLHDPAYDGKRLKAFRIRQFM